MPMREHQGERAHRRTEMLRGGVVYALGDSVAAWMTGEFSLLRLVGMGLVGGTVYAYEISHYFRWIEQSVVTYHHPQLARTSLALVYFNPLWIARHLFFIKLFSGDWPGISSHLVRVGCESFVFNIPLTVAANYVIQNKLPLTWRFTGSAVFAGLMAVYYALSGNWLAS